MYRNRTEYIYYISFDICDKNVHLEQIVMEAQ